MMFDNDGFGLEEAMVLGTGYALLRHGQDVQTRQLVDALQHINALHNESDLDDDALFTAEDEPVEVINNLDFVDTSDLPDEWDDYIGQEPLKRQLQVSIDSAILRGAPLPHILLASGYPGVGKTRMARLIARITDSPIIELVPPFKGGVLVEAASRLPDRGILFIDEIHKLTDGVGIRGAEILLKILEERVAHLPDGEVVYLNDITVIGATTDRDRLPETVIDRFKLKPYFQAYSDVELCRIAIHFAYRHGAEDMVSDEHASAIADACRGTPRIIEEMVVAVRDLTLSQGAEPTIQQLLDFLEVEADGLTRTHIHYLTALRQYFGRMTKDETVEYIVGEAAIQQILRETKQGIGRVERFLVERGLIDRTPRGRRLSPRGIVRAEEFIRAGKGVSDVA